MVAERENVNNIFKLLISIDKRNLAGNIMQKINNCGD
jgi:hypothetical protein